MRLAWRQLLCLKGNIGVIVHGPRGCGNDLSLPTSDGGSAPSDATNLTETEVVMGGEEALEQKIEAVYRRSRPEAIFVLGTCVSELIGDDVVAIAAQAQERLGIPVIALPTSGLVGTETWGSSAVALTTLVEMVMRPGPVIERTVNIASQSWPSDAHLEEEISQRLAALDIRVHVMLTGGPSLVQAVAAPRAALNVFTTRDHAKTVGEELEARFGQPYIVAPMPFGLSATTRFFRSIVEHFDATEEQLALVDGWARLERERISAQHPQLRGKTVAIVASRPSRSEAEAFADLGLKPTVFVRERPRPGQEREWAQKWLRLGVPVEQWTAAAQSDLDRFDILYMDDPRAPSPASYRPHRHMRLLPEFMLYSGMRELAQELASEFASRYFQVYGKYLR